MFTAHMYMQCVALLHSQRDLEECFLSEAVAAVQPEVEQSWCELITARGAATLELESANVSYYCSAMRILRGSL
jgi:hypothetical protein